MEDIRLADHEGLKLGWAVLDTGRGFVTGLASVCEELLQLLGCDVLLLGVTHTNAKGQPFLSLIGRATGKAEFRAVDLNAVTQTWKGGGHPAAAAASIKLGHVPPPPSPPPPSPPRPATPAVGSLAVESTVEALAALEGGLEGLEALDGDGSGGGVREAAYMEEAYWVMQQAVSLVVKSVPAQPCASDLMSTTIHACAPADTMEAALALMNRVRKRVLPVLGEEGELMGYLKFKDPIKAAQAGKGQQQVKAWMRRELLTVNADTPLDELEAMLLAGSTGRLHVVDKHNKLLGLVSRTDMLRHYQHYTTDLAALT